MTTNTAAILDALRAAAVEIDGQWWVRASAAVRVLGLSTSWYESLASRHQIAELRRPFKSSRGSLRVEVWWLLDGLSRFARCRSITRHRRVWSEQDDRTLIKSASTMTITQIGRKLTRTARAVRCRIERLGGLHGLIQEHDHLITSGTLMRLVRKKSYETIRQWRRKGLPCHRLPSRRADALYRLEDVREFLIVHPNLLVTLHPASRKLLRLTAADLERRAA